MKWWVKRTVWRKGGPSSDDSELKNLTETVTHCCGLFRLFWGGRGHTQTCDEKKKKKIFNFQPNQFPTKTKTTYSDGSPPRGNGFSI